MILTSSKITITDFHGHMPLEFIVVDWNYFLSFPFARFNYWVDWQSCDKSTIRWINWASVNNYPGQTPLIVCPSYQRKALKDEGRRKKDHLLLPRGGDFQFDPFDSWIWHQRITSSSRPSRGAGRRLDQRRHGEGGNEPVGCKLAFAFDLRIEAEKEREMRSQLPRSQ